MNASREEIRVAIEGYVAALNKMGAEKKDSILDADKFSIENGTRYAKIVRLAHGNSRSVHSFVDRGNGDILKAASWRAPAKHPRGSVLDKDFGMRRSGASCYGVRYL